MTSEHNHDHAKIVAAKAAEWEKQDGIMWSIGKEGAGVLFEDSAIEETHIDHFDSVCCMDEGTAQMEGDETRLAMAGSGILFPAVSWEERLEKVADLYITLGIKTITSHDGCGAAGIAWRRDGGADQTGFRTPDEYGKAWVKDLEKVINTKLEKMDKEIVSTRHINSEEMVRPAEFHNARMVYFDATGKFNPHFLGDKMPKGFLINYGVEKNTGVEENKDYAFAELQVAIDIALGGHGFSQKFTPESPFVIGVIANTQEELEEIGGKVDKMVEKYDGRVRFDKILHEIK